MEISVSVIAHNEEKNLEGLLQNIKNFANEIVVINCDSQDETEDVAKRYFAKVYRRPNLKNLNVNKQFGITQCTKDWILYLDPDERLSKGLEEEIKKVIEETEFDAFYIPRLNFVLNRPLKFGGHYPDRQLRLFRRGKGEFPCEHVHEKLKIKGKAGYLKNNLLHYPYQTIEDFIKKLEFYSDFHADYLFEREEKVDLIKMFVKPFFRFKRRFYLKLGFLDGIPGFISLFFDLSHQVISYAKLWEKRCENKKHKSFE
jgi:glycosyltransferase involved in cell wall biosynthesis